jgi:hypothetical protein
LAAFSVCCCFWRCADDPAVRGRRRGRRGDGGQRGGAGHVTDGNELYKDCTASTNTSFGFCYGYVAAIADAARGNVTLNGVSGGVYGVKHCLAKEITMKEAVDIVLRWLAQNPETRHSGASTIVATALAEAFPCPE